ncbi:endo-1,4-beta-xylanase [Leptolyngbya sp. AN03gr2]|uniref:endo-1,4-beta-xylanase n=1 Tax=unclassified Leptolyngbya TaxID=2650499 RepID=UPI003D3218F3
MSNVASLKRTADFIRQFWLQSQPRDRELELGANFSHRYVAELGLSWESVYGTLVNALGVRYLRIPTYWDEIEPCRRQFDWSLLDRILTIADAAQISVVLTVGHRSPRWPECYCPTWAKSLDDHEFTQCLLQYVATVVAHTKHFNCIEAWQLENEPTASRWGVGCRDLTAILQTEIEVVKQQDPQRPILLTYPNLPWLISMHHPIISLADIVGIDVYNTVYFRHSQYAGYIDLLNLGIVAPLSLQYQRHCAEKCAKELWITELQAEPWGPTHNATLSRTEWQKSMTPAKLIQLVNQARQSGIRRAYLWGVEWWIFEQEQHGNAAMWETGKSLLCH